NHPNPFNPITNINFSISGSKTTQTHLSVFDILGREIEILVNEILKPGNYNVNWVATNYPSGVYFYKLTAENYNETRKMILIK
ncbi:MAG: T9SS type A sorting domain-containing protein, partial [Ignavibacteria bacterium]|nr:T9SS type A sorting domain-containing protein [Ignavibacteria bacterium]